MSKDIIVYWCSPTDNRMIRLQWLDPETGLRRSQSAETRDPVVAEKRRAALEYELNHGLFQQKARMAWEDFRRKFEEEYVAGQRDKSREKHAVVLDVFEAICKPQHLGRITERTISLFVKGMRERELRGGKIGLAPMTQKNYLISLHTALSWAVKQKMMPKVPDFPTIKVPKKKPQPINDADFQKLLAAMPDATWQTYLMLGWWAGLRLAEAYQLRWSYSPEHPWIDWERSRIILPAQFVKADEDQWVPIHPELQKALEALPRTQEKVFPWTSPHGGPLTQNAISNRIIYVAQRIGVKLSMHRLRKGFGCRVAQHLGHGNAPVLHRLMRHSSMQITMDYYANVDDVLDESIREL